MKYKTKEEALQAYNSLLQNVSWLEEEVSKVSKNIEDASSEEKISELEGRMKYLLSKTRVELRNLKNIEDSFNNASSCES